MAELPPFLKNFIGPHTKKPNVIGRLPNKKPIIGNPDGSVSTVYSDIVQDKNLNAGKPTLIPTIIGGEFFSTDEALDIIKRNAGHDPDTGENLQSFNTMEEGVAASKSLSKQHGEVMRLMEMRKLFNLLGIDKRYMR